MDRRRPVILIPGEGSFGLRRDDRGYLPSQIL